MKFSFLIYSWFHYSAISGSVPFLFLFSFIICFFLSCIFSFLLPRDFFYLFFSFISFASIISSTSFPTPFFSFLHFPFFSYTSHLLLFFYLSFPLKSSMEWFDQKKRTPLTESHRVQMVSEKVRKYRGCCNRSTGCICQNPCGPKRHVQCF